MSDMTRRGFVGTAATLAAGITIVPRHVLGGPGYQAPSDTLNVAIVGAGGMGMSNWSQLLGENVVAICDVDMPYVERAIAGRLRVRPPTSVPATVPEAERAKWMAERTASAERQLKEAQAIEQGYRKAAKYADFRRMLDRQKDLDGIVVATPDHLHAVIAERAMRAGKHVYMQKPLAATVHESRLLARTARALPKIVTQMGNQGHSGEGTRRIRELIAAGVIGRVSEVHVWTDRPVRYWAQGIPRPEAPRAAVAPATAPTPPAPLALSDGVPLPAAPPRWNMRTVDNAVLAAMAANPQAPPPGLDWDLYCGPVPPIPYHPAYHPFSWRGWTDFGVGAIGDMGAHLIDQPYWALDLGQPTSVSASSTPWGGAANDPASYPLAMTAEYEFPANGARGPVKLFWYDGGLMPPRPAHLPDDQTLPRDDGGGGVFIGERGILVYETYGNNPRVFPPSLQAAADAVPKTIARIDVPHEVNWVRACKQQGEASSPFAYAAALNETMLLPIVALRAGQGRKLRYDAAAMAFPDAPEANPFLTRRYRHGWSL
ncbi:MAG: Gfo/Idh/MocA family oxidoreductase [Gemmatirosa sp.]